MVNKTSTIKRICGPGLTQSVVFAGYRGSVSRAEKCEVDVQLQRTLVHLQVFHYGTYYGFLPVPVLSTPLTRLKHLERRTHFKKCLR